MSPRTRTPSLLVRNAQVVTMDPDRRVLRSGWLAVDSDRIVGLGPGNDCPYDRRTTSCPCWRRSSG